MKGVEYGRHKAVALSLAGSAILLVACSGPAPVEQRSNESVMTEHSVELTMLMTENGIKSYRFRTPLLEGYKLAKEPYMEFRKGIDIETYKEDTTAVDSHLSADYAIFFEDRKLWEAKGNVVSRNSKGETLYTQQLFWDQKSKRIYSNVDCKVEMGSDYWFGEGFESDESMNDWHFRRYRGRMWVDTEPTRPADSTAVAPPAADTTGRMPAVKTDGKPQESAQKPASDERKKPAERESESNRELGRERLKTLDL